MLIQKKHKKYMMRKFSFLMLSLLILSLSSCGNDGELKDTSTDVSTETPPKTKVRVPKFNKDSAYVFIEEQVAFGPRVPNTKEHQACRAWMVGKLKSFGADVIEQTVEAQAYTGVTLKGANIIGQYNPAAKKRVLLAAHWDTRHMSDHDEDENRRTEPVLGADDGGSGVGILLEIARQLQANPIEMGVDIVFFDLEDHGDGVQNAPDTWCLGSQYWSRNPHVPNYKAKYGILLDMVGSENPRFTKEQISMRYAPKIMNKVWKLASGMGYGNFFVDTPGRQLTDDHVPVNQIAKIPMIDIINNPAGSQSGFMKHWHTSHDDMEHINKRSLKAVGQVVLATVYKEANGDF